MAIDFLTDHSAPVPWLDLNDLMEPMLFTSSTSPPTYFFASVVVFCILFSNYLTLVLVTPSLILGVVLGSSPLINISSFTVFTGIFYDDLVIMPLTNF